jgi:nucleotide-binding universal stress UspA family protein
MSSLYDKTLTLLDGVEVASQAQDVMDVGEVAEMILNYFIVVQIDIIVVGVHGHSDLACWR